MFSDFLYERPDLAQYKKKFESATQTFSTAKNYTNAKHAMKKLNAMRSEMTKNMKLAYIRHSINTKDDFYNQENEFWDHHEPLVDQLHNTFYQSLLASPFKTDLLNDYPETLFLFAEDQLALLNESVIELKQKENEVVSRYTQLIASAGLLFDGKKCTLSELAAYFSQPDRELRKTAQEAYIQFFSEHESEFDQIFDQLVHLRDQQAKNLGFANYVEYGDRLMNRWSYS
ncbi:MAG: M3 family oligoendopeptidase, partial [Enterococcus sp.]